MLPPLQKIQHGKFDFEYIFMALMIDILNLTILAQSQYCAGYFDTKHSIKQTDIPTIRGNLIFPVIF